MLRQNLDTKLLKLGLLKFPVEQLINSEGVGSTGAFLCELNVSNMPYTEAFECGSGSLCDLPHVLKLSSRHLKFLKSLMQQHVLTLHHMSDLSQSDVEITI